MLSSPEIDQLAAALVLSQAELPEVTKDATAEVVSKRTGGRFSYQYATMPEVQRAILPVLTGHGIAVVQGTEDEDDSGFTVVTTLIHTSGQWLACRVRVPIAEATAQAAGSGFSYGRRIGLVGAVGLITDDLDDDGAAATHQTGHSRGATTPPKADRPAKAPQSPPSTPEASCPECGGPMWDNRENKRNPRAPDFKCRDKGCEGVYWPGQWPPKPEAGESTGADPDAPLFDPMTGEPI